MVDISERDREMAVFLAANIVTHYRDGIAHEVGRSQLPVAQHTVANMCKSAIAQARAEGAAEAAEQLAAKDKRIAELEAENARLKASARFAELEADNSRQKSLSMFAQHKWDCRLNMSATESCTCGLDAALAQKGGAQ